MSLSTDDTRRRFMAHFAGIGLGSTLVPGVVWARMQDQGTQRVTATMVKEALRLQGVELPDADIEGMVGRAWRTSLLAGADCITREALAQVVAQFMPSTQGLERELQETAAILECTDRQFLPAAILEKTDAEGGRAKLQARLTALKQLVSQL